jgi:5-formyltetrahydrofolate cyclo-ligase
MRQRLGDSPAQAAEKSRAIVASIMRHPAWARARVLALYSALPSEPDLQALWSPELGDRRLDEGVSRRFGFPRTGATGMAFFEVQSPEELLAASWHPRIREPVFDPARLLSPEGIDLIVVPGLAFTRDGRRLGRGGGYYDRYLASLPAEVMKLGVCFHCQLVDSLPLESHDQRVHAVVTENGTE